MKSSIENVFHKQAVKNGYVTSDGNHQLIHHLIKIHQMESGETQLPGRALWNHVFTQSFKYIHG